MDYGRILYVRYFVPAFLPGNLWYVFLESIYGADDFPPFVHQQACWQSCFLALRKFESVLGVFRASSMFLPAVKAELSHFHLFHFFVVFLLFVCQLATARFLSQLASAKPCYLALRASSMCSGTVGSL